MSKLYFSSATEFSPTRQSTRTLRDKAAQRRLALS